MMVMSRLKMAGYCLKALRGVCDIWLRAGDVFAGERGGSVYQQGYSVSFANAIDAAIP